MQGAADMFLQMIGAVNEAESGKYQSQMLIRHLPRLYMENFLKRMLNDRKIASAFPLWQQSSV